MKQDGDRPRRKWPWVVLGIVVAMLVPASWMLAHRLSSRTLPAPPWPESELPTPPDPAVNGLDDLVLPGPSRVRAVDSDLRELVRALDADAPQARWADVEQQQAAIAAWMDVGIEHELRSGELARIDAVLAAPYFADPCVSVGSECRWLQVVDAARLAIVADLDAALRGDWPEAFARAHELQLASDELIATARTMVANTVALLFARLAVDHLRVLVAGYRAEAAGGAARTALPELRSTVDASTTTLAALRRDEVSARRALIAECFWIRSGIRPILEDPATFGGPGGFLGRYLVDVRGTINASDARFVELMRWVEAPDHATRAPPPTREHASGVAWWLWNPGGKVLLDIAAFDLSSAIHHIDEGADALFASREALRTEVRALTQ